ncbi:MAG: hypothetical protein GC154_16335 [bacterium]|nr:hypothetical protein [bacterium]
MNAKRSRFIGIALLTLFTAALTTNALNARGEAVQPSITFAAEPFALEQVRLLDGPFKDAMDRDMKYLLDLEPDRLLAGFRENAGLEPKAKKYGGWESMSIAGHSLGHYLSACSLAYAASGDERFKERVQYIVDELSRCQDESGYVAAIPEGKRIFAEVARGEIRSAGFDLNGGWVPWYTLHKQFAGLLDANQYCQNGKALDVAKKLGDWAIQVTSGLTHEQFQKMLACEHGGMNEVLAELYARTGETKYLDLSRRFHHQAVLDPLAAGQDRLAGLHANTQIPKIIGVARRFELTGDPRDRSIAEFFWNRMVNHHTYVNGGNSDHEHLGQPDHLSHRLSDNTSETCNTYNMLKLSRHLFEWSGAARYAEYIERALYNHILASQNPDDGMMCYFIPLRSGALKTYSTPYDSFWCCTGSGMENHVRYGESIYFHHDNDLFVNLFIASRLDWPQQGCTLTQETSFPAGGKVKITIQTKAASEFSLNIRKPGWAASEIDLRVNGKPVAIDTRLFGYLTITREWNDGDEVEFELPMSLHMEAMPDDPQLEALFYGPLLLAGDLGPAEEENAVTPVLITNDKPLSQWIRRTSSDPLRFKTRGAGRPGDVELVPFYQMHHRRYEVYWDVLTQEQWKAREALIREKEKRERELEARTVDVMRIGEMQPERDHNLKGEKTETGAFNGMKWRHAVDGGWFSFTMKCDPEQSQSLICTYWGGDSGARHFDVTIDGEKVDEVTLNNNAPGEFFDKTIPIDQALTDGKKSITVRFQAHPGNMAGGLFFCRLVRND